MTGTSNVTGDTVDVTTKGLPNGVASLDATGNVPAAQLGNASGGGGGGVTLAADLGGTTSLPHVVATHLASPLPVNQGGTAATSASAALTSLGALPLAGGTMTGAIAMGANKLTGVGNGSGAQDAAAFGQIPVLAAADTSIVVAGTATAPTLATATLDVIATVHAPAASVPMNGQKFTGLANGTAPGDSLTYGQMTGGPTPADVGLVAWTMDPYVAVGTFGPGQAETAGTVYGTALWVRRNVTISTLVVVTTVNGTTLTANSCWGLLYSSNGTLVAQTTDRSTAWAAGAATQAMALTAVTSLALTPGMYWAGIVSSGTTLPTFRATSSGVNAVSANFGAGLLAVASSRCCVLATGVTTAPGNITPSAITQTAAQPLLAGIY
jgi:hypothetical protein